MSDTPRTDAQKRGDFVHINFARELERENAALRDSIDHAETLLCNSLPMAHCKQSEWDNVIRKWRDQKHAIDAARKEKP